MSSCLFHPSFIPSNLLCSSCCDSFFSCPTNLFWVPQKTHQQLGAPKSSLSTRTVWARMNAVSSVQCWPCPVRVSPVFLSDNKRAFVTRSTHTHRCIYCPFMRVLTRGQKAEGKSACPQVYCPFSCKAQLQMQGSLPGCGKYTRGTLLLPESFKLTREPPFTLFSTTSPLPLFISI